MFEGVAMLCLISDVVCFGKKRCKIVCAAFVTDESFTTIIQLLIRHLR